MYSQAVPLFADITAVRCSDVDFDRYHAEVIELRIGQDFLCKRQALKNRVQRPV